MDDQKMELLILRRDPGGSDERPKNEIAYNTVKSWWLKNMELSISRRDPGFSNKPPKSGVPYATARSWDHMGEPKSVKIDENLEKLTEIR